MYDFFIKITGARKWTGYYSLQFLGKTVVV